MSSRRLRGRKIQTRLSFTPVPSPSPSGHEARVHIEDTYNPVKRRRVNGSRPDAGVRQLSPELAKAIKLSKQENLRVLVDLPQYKSDQLPTPEPSSQIEHPEEDGSSLRGRRGLDAPMPAQDSRTNSSPIISPDSSEAQADEENPVRSTRRVRRTPVTMDNSSDDLDIITPLRRRQRKSRETASAISSPEPFCKPTPSRGPTARTFLAGGTSGNAPLSRSPRLISRFTQPKRGVYVGISSESDTEAPVRARRSSKAANPQRSEECIAENDDEEEASDEILRSPVRRRAGNQPYEEQSQDDDSMLEELADAEDGVELGSRRTRGRQGTSARSKRLEGLAKLRQRRAGVLEVSDEEESEGVDENKGEVDDAVEDDTPDEDFACVMDEPNRTLDDYESDFVEDDGDIGIDLIRNGVPLRFTSHANKKPFDYFKDEVEWMVHNKLDPAFERHDEIYEMAHRKLNDEVIGLAGSEFKSSIWKPNFTKALQSRPEFFTTSIGIDTWETKCEACNRSKHPPKWMITFSGPTYDSNSLERMCRKPSEGSDSSSGDEDDEEEEPEERWHVGSVCCGNAEVAHALYHWRFQLNATVLQWLNVNGFTSPAKILERENWSRKKREKLANKVVDGMVETGEMRSLYKQFKQNLDAARAARDERVQR